MTGIMLGLMVRGLALAVAIIALWDPQCVDKVIPYILGAMSVTGIAWRTLDLFVHGQEGLSFLVLVVFNLGMYDCVFSLAGLIMVATLSTADKADPSTCPGFVFVAGGVLFFWGVLEAFVRLVVFIREACCPTLAKVDVAPPA